LPDCEEVDHVNHNGLDNRRQNLRAATRLQNSANKRKRKDGLTSHYRGVNWDKSKDTFVAQICANGKKVKLGSFASEEAAAIMYNIFAKRYVGEFANLNTFPEPTAIEPIAA
jgi:hypothetical protein